MQVTVGRHICINDPTPEIYKYCAKNLVLSNPDYIKKTRMGFWVGDTPEKIYLYESRDNALILPFGVLRDILPLLDRTSIFTVFPRATEVDYHCMIPLYGYQDRAVAKMYDEQYGILRAPAGSGKTQMGLALIAQIGVKALWITHTADLLRQSKNRALLYMSEDLIGTITEGRVNVGKGITFATVQTLSTINLLEYRDMWDCIVVDECHRVAGSPAKITQFSKVLSSLSARHKYGLSATVHRSDGTIKATYALLGQVVYTVPDEEVEDKIMRVGIQEVNTGIGLSYKCLNGDGTLNHTKMITYLTEEEERNKIIVENILKNAGRSSLILSDRLEHLSELMSMLPAEERVKAAMISGQMVSKKGKGEREAAIEDMRQGRKKYLFATYSLAKEGLDIPCLERLYMATPQKDYAVITQSIGRIARTYPGKSDPIAYDFIDDDEYLVRCYKKRCTTYRKNKCYFKEK